MENRISSTLVQPDFKAAPRPAGEGPRSRFTLPQVHLLNALSTGFGGKPGPYADEAARLEADCLEGTIVPQAEFGVARYEFQPNGAPTSLGLQLSSALVTELMPLVVALRNAQHIPFLVLEEPEAHLHPTAQRAVIRCLCRLVRRGVRVLITTHSPFVAQQINNLIKLGELNPDQRATAQQRFRYREDEYLAADDVAVNQFAFRGDLRTEVRPLQLGPGGFAMPTFNDALHAFAEEIAALDEAGETNP